MCAQRTKRHDVRSRERIRDSLELVGERCEVLPLRALPIERRHDVRSRRKKKEAPCALRKGFVWGDNQINTDARGPDGLRNTR